MIKASELRKLSDSELLDTLSVLLNVIRERMLSQDDRERLLCYAKELLEIAIRWYYGIEGCG